MAEERLQKILSRAGIASRRAAEALILEGKVQINGKVVRELGTRADASRDVIRVEDKVIAEPEALVHFVLYKPERVVTTLEDPEGRTSVGDLVRRARVKVYPVGRLDYDAEGALLLTNDGALAHKLTHPRWGVRRTYLAKVKGVPAEAALERMRTGVRLEDGEARAIEATFEKQTPKNAWIRLVVAEGRHHLVKRLCEAVGHPVVRLFRSDYGGVGVAGMQPGDLRPLDAAELHALRMAVAKEAPLPPGGRPRRRTVRTQVAVRDPIYGTARPAGGFGAGRGAGGGTARGGRASFGARGGTARGAGESFGPRTRTGRGAEESFGPGTRTARGAGESFGPRGGTTRGEGDSAGPGSRTARGAGEFSPRTRTTRGEGAFSPRTRTTRGEGAFGPRTRTTRGEGESFGDRGGTSRGGDSFGARGGESAATRRPARGGGESVATRRTARGAGESVGPRTRTARGEAGSFGSPAGGGRPSGGGVKRPSAPGARPGARAGSRPRGPAKPRR